MAARVHDDGGADEAVADAAVGDASALSLPRPLRALDDGALRTICAVYPNLTELNVDGNELTSDAISPRLASALPALTSITMAWNRLTVVPQLAGLSRLTSLNLSDNRM